MRLRSRHILRELIRQEGRSHRDLAALVGCSHGFVDHLTSGRRVSCTTELASAIARALRVKIDFLFAAGDSASLSTGQERVARAA